MKKWGAAALGITTSLLTALAITAIANISGFNLFTFSLWIVVPVGAVLTGFAASSGFYFGSLYFHVKASKAMLAQMVVVAGATQILIYYLEYATLVLDSGERASSLVSFSEYITLSLTTASYVIGRARVDTGEVGSLGYAIALVQLIGFCVGGYFLHRKLLGQSVCSDCDAYLRPLRRSEKRFATPEDATAAYAALCGGNVSPETIAPFLALPTDKEGKTRIELTLHGCPSCKGQHLEVRPEVFNGRDWVVADQLWRIFSFPAGANHSQLFAAR